MKPSSTTGFLPKRLLLFNMPKTPPPGQRDQRTDVTKAEAAFRLCRYDRYAQETLKAAGVRWTALSSQTRRTSQHFCVLLFSRSYCVVEGAFYFSLWTTERGISCPFLPSFRLWLTKNLAHTDANARDADQALRIVTKLRHGSDARPVHPAVKGELQPWRGTTESSEMSCAGPTEPCPRHTHTHLCTRWRNSAATSLWWQIFYMLSLKHSNKDSGGGGVRARLLCCVRCSSLSVTLWTYQKHPQLVSKEPYELSCGENQRYDADLWFLRTQHFHNLWPLTSTWPGIGCHGNGITAVSRKGMEEKITVKGRPSAAKMLQWNKYRLEAGRPGLASPRGEWSIAMKHRSIPRGSNFNLMTLEP